MNSKFAFGLLILILVVFSIFYKDNTQGVEIKEFTAGSYYQGYNSDESPDYKRIYSEQNTGITNSQVCSRDAVPISNGRSAYKPNSELGFMWFWAIPQSESSTASELLKSGESVGDGWTLYKVPKGTELIAIADGKLVPQTQYPQGLYPSGVHTKGVHLSYDILLPDKKVGFRITYMSMEKWWLCADKTEPDSYVNNDNKKPIYVIGETVGVKDLYSSTVVGYSGYTGVPDTLLNSTESFLMVKVEKAEVNEDGQVTGSWGKGTIEELYSGGT